MKGRKQVRSGPLRAADEIRSTGTVIVGGGPGGIAPLIAASRDHLLGDLLAHGLVLAERSSTLGRGSIGRYAINSDSSAETFLTATNGIYPRLTASSDRPIARHLTAFGKDCAPLRMAGDLLGEIGHGLRNEIRAHQDSAVLSRHTALWTRRTSGGGWITRLRSSIRHVTVDIHSRNVILATGAHQPVERLFSEIVGDAPLLPRLEGKVLQSEQVLTRVGLLGLTARLRKTPTPRIVIVGGSTSAMSVAHALLHRAPGLSLPHGAITLMHRRDMNVFFPSRDAAVEHGYDAFDEDDICPVSGFVHRFGGLRFDNRELLMQLLNIGGRPPEPRVILHRLDKAPIAQTRRLVDEADIVIACFGYRPRALPVFDHNARRTALLVEKSSDAPLIGANCGVLDADGAEIPGLMAIGLASGFSPRGAMNGALGGEPSFRGQFNGLWLWQNDIGRIIAERALARITQTQMNTRSVCAQPAEPDLAQQSAVHDLGMRLHTSSNAFTQEAS